jgi:Domain of unknown function (DUF4333)
MTSPRSLGGFRAAAVGLILLTGSVGAGGCGETVIDPDKTEGAIQSSLEKSFHEKISVSCPSGQEVEAGATFACRVEFSSGKHATATLKIRNKDADVTLVGLKPTD